MTRHNQNNHPLRRLKDRISVKKAKRRDLMLKQAKGDCSRETEMRIQRLTQKIQEMKFHSIQLRKPKIL